ncbi:MAG: hypothetical protein IKU32_06280 [Clostridia bacterium]|jgi:hypothetical protein|nr:hypothetical protein [Clostridia bacterium]
MSDYIKDLNIIDFLGIIVPGSILVLLISGDNADLLLLWTSYFGADASSLVRSIFLAIAGYLAGMILHEIGDLAEKGVWCFTRLDPKAYAINAVGVEALNDAATTAKLNDQVTADQHCVFLPWFRGVLGCILAVVILGSCTLGFSYAMQSAVNDATTLMTTTYTSQDVNTVPVDVATSANALGTSAAQPTPNNNETNSPKDSVQIGHCSYSVSSIALATLLVSVGTIGSKLFRNYNAKNKPARDCRLIKVAKTIAKKCRLDKVAEAISTECGLSGPKSNPGDWKTLQRLCLQNPQIQTHVAKNGAPKKMSMFDSFRHVMRNLLIAVAIVNVFSIWHPIDLYRDIAAHFISAGNISCDFGTLTFWFCFVILFAFSRYSHFVFLRYKYSYEAFVTQNSQDEKSDVPDYRIVLEHKNYPQGDT